MKNPINPIHEAIMKDDVDLVRVLVNQGCDIDAFDIEYRTPLHYASSQSSLEILEELIKNGAKLNIRDKNLQTPLHMACQENRFDAVELLINGGAEVDPQDIHGNTPLFRAVFAFMGDGRIIDKLLKSGADKNKKNNYDNSPLDLARIIANYDVIKFLE